TNGSVVPDANPTLGFDVTGTHTFRQVGPVSVAVHITDKDGDSASVRTTSIVADAALAATGTTLQTKSNQPLRNVVVATFTDGNPFATISDFVATVDWGDGSTSKGLISKTQTGFAVLGSHTYSIAGAYSVQAHIRDGSANSVSAQYYTPVNLVS